MSQSFSPLDPKNNRIPQPVKTVHLIAVCGTAMGALAAILKDLGLAVTGSDGKVYPPMSDFLAGKGIAVAQGFGEKNLLHRPDLVVVGNAVRRDNPEVVKTGEMGIPYCSMPQAINRFLAAGKKIVLITGTHGKTTTSSLAAWVLHSAGLDPSFLIGGILKNFDSNYRVGASKYVVLEGDEYDTAFFDKGPKFLHYPPHTAVVTGVEFDHADIYRDLAHVRQAFDRLLASMPAESRLLAFDRDENLAPLLTGRSYEIQKYGDCPSSSWRLGDFTIAPPWTRFEVFRKEEGYGTFFTPMPGRHNLFNALSVIGIADNLGISREEIAKALKTFKGVRRRQEVRGVKNNITVMDDFAHHPTAVRETVRAVKPFYPEGRLIAVFEPRTNTSMRNVFQDVYPDAFDGADLICIRKPPLLEKIPQGERFSSEKLVEDLMRRGKPARFFQDTDTIIEFVLKEAKPGDLILVMSNGGFDNIHERLLSSL